MDNFLNQFESNLYNASINIENNKDLLKYLNSSLIELEKIYENIEKKGTTIPDNFEIISEKINNYFSILRNMKSKRFDINFLLNQILNILFSNINFYSLICKDNKITIYFLNNSLNIIENIRGTQYYELMIRKIHLYMNYIFQNNKKLRIIVNELIRGFSIHHSLKFKAFTLNLQNNQIIKLCGSDNSKEKEKGIDEVVDIISNTVSFAEQFELLYQSAPDVLTNLLREPSEEYQNAYIKFGNLLNNLLYYNKYRLNIKENDEIQNQNKISFIKNGLNCEIKEFEFLKDKLYQLTFQKEILDLNDKIVEVCLLYIQCVIKYDKLFNIQFNCYLLLRRIYFNFPQFRNEIGDYIITSITNLAKFQGQNEWNKSLESRQFSYYLLINDKILSKKIKTATAVPDNDITYEKLFLNDYNLQIGFNINIIVDAGKKIERKIEIIDYNSLTFINLINEENENINEININLLKLDIEKNEWNNVELKENSNKIILFCEEPSMYKLIFDNSKAWIKKKKVIYSLIFLKPFQIKE